MDLIFDRLISFKTAKMAKENGFFNKSEYAYNIDFPDSGAYVNKDTPSDKILEAPTQSLLQKWIRGYKLHIEIILTEDESCEKFRYSITSYEKRCIVLNGKHYDTYEDALETGLQKGLEIIKEIKLLCY